MDLQLQFVDSISASPVVRLDLDTAPWSTQVGTRFDPPPMKYAVADTLLADGEHIAASAYRDRTIVLRLRLLDVTEDEAAEQHQLLFRELNRPSNFLRYQPGTSEPVWFRTKRCSADAVDFDPVEKTVTVQVPAEPFAYGLKETLPQVSVTNDPVGVPGPILNANPFFETDALNWSASGGTFVRSTAQFHQGAASGLLTPDGVTANSRAVSESVPATPGVTYRLSAWLRCAVSRNVNLQSIFFDAGAASLGTTTTTVGLTAGTWTFADMTVTAPPTTATGILRVEMTSTPPAGHTLHIDEAMLREASGEGSMFFDVTSPKGDVETPLVLSAPNGLTGQLQGNDSVVAVRRRGNPANVPFLLQAESMNLGVDTTLPGNDAVMSGTGSNYARCSFATSTALVSRLNTAAFPAAGSTDVRGTYRVFGRFRKSSDTDVILVQFAYGADDADDVIVRNDSVTTVGEGPQTLDLGLITLAGGMDPVTDGYSGVEIPAAGTRIRLYIQRVSGSGTVDVDYLLFVPADDRFAAVHFGYTLLSAPIDLWYLDAITDGVYFLNNSGHVVPLIDARAPVGGLPMVSPGVTNRIYFLREVDPGGSPDDKTRTTTITPYYWPRYLHVRPATT